MMEDYDRLQQEEHYTNLNQVSVRYRNQFITKVYSLVSLQMLCTFLFVLLSVFSKGYQQFYMENFWLFFVCFVVSIAVVYAIAYTQISRRVPHNYILLLVFILSESYWVSAVGIVYKPEAIFLAATLTLLITVSLTIYAFTTKQDLTICGSALFILFALVIGVGIV